MESIDVGGLPEPFVKAIAAMVECLRRQPADSEKGPPTKPVRLSTWPGKVLGQLTREEIYDDRD